MGSCSGLRLAARILSWDGDVHPLCRICAFSCKRGLDWGSYPDPWDFCDDFLPAEEAPSSLEMWAWGLRLSLKLRRWPSERAELRSIARDLEEAAERIREAVEAGVRSGLYTSAGEV